MNETHKKLQALYEVFTNELSNITDASQMMECLKKQLLCYSEIIRSFFTGKDNEIRNIYQAIREQRFPYNTVHGCDVNFAIHAYKDYLEGLSVFVFKVLDLNDSDMIDINKIHETAISVMERDSEFMDEIFGGSKNPNVDMDLDSAMKNIESLLDINDNISSYIEICKRMIDIVNAHPTEVYKDVRVEGIKIFISSISNYNYKSIDSVLTTYENILNSMNERVPVKGNPVVPTYQLF